MNVSIIIYLPSLYEKHSLVVCSRTQQADNSHKIGTDKACKQVRAPNSVTRGDSTGNLQQMGSGTQE